MKNPKTGAFLIKMKNLKTGAFHFGLPFCNKKDEREQELMLIGQTNKGFVSKC